MNQPLLNSSRSFTLLGVLNVTPDSFYDGGRHPGVTAAIGAGIELRAQGADWVDVGGESSRPGSAEVSPGEEWERVGPVVTGLVREQVPVSIDTRHPEVAERALAAGAGLLNDITALADPRMAGIVSGHQANILLMHMQGTPKTMQDSPTYADVLAEVRVFLHGRVEHAQAHGIPLERIAVDPGIGFGKRLAHNLELLHGLRALQGLGSAIAVGVSRKSFLGLLTGADADARLPGSLAAAVCAYLHGARIFRVHDVLATRDALLVTEAVQDHGT